MCLDPISLAGTGLGIVGSIMNGKQEAKNEQRMADARTRAMLDNFAQQDKLSAQSRQQFQDALGDFSKPQQQQNLENVGQERTNAIQANINANKVDYNPASENAPEVVKSEIAKRMADAMEKGRANATSLGKMGAWGDVQFGNQAGLARRGSQVGEFSNFARNVAGMMPLQMEVAAKNARKAPSMIGDLFKLAGTGMSMVGGAGGFGNIFGGGTPAPSNEIFWYGPRWGG